jgi:hypothetical protein
MAIKIFGKTEFANESVWERLLGGPRRAPETTCRRRTQKNAEETNG